MWNILLRYTESLIKGSGGHACITSKHRESGETKASERFAEGIDGHVEAID